MPLDSKIVERIIVGVISIACSKLFFFWLSDPEGANFLIVALLAALLYTVSTALSSYWSVAQYKKLVIILLLQLLLVSIAALVLK
jgi:uncharacterized membrane protein YccC